MYPVSRSWAVESQLSSAAAARTSTGKLMVHLLRSMSARTSRTASGIAPSGMAYSISRKRTARCEVKTAGEKSENSRSPVIFVAPSTSRASAGVRPGAIRPAAQIAR